MFGRFDRPSIVSRATVQAPANVVAAAANYRARGADIFLEAGQDRAEQRPACDGCAFVALCAAADVTLARRAPGKIFRRGTYTLRPDIVDTLQGYGVRFVKGLEGGKALCYESVFRAIEQGGLLGASEQVHEGDPLVPGTPQWFADRVTVAIGDIATRVDNGLVV